MPKKPITAERKLTLRIEKLEKQLNTGRTILLSMGFMGITKTMTPEMQEAISTWIKETE